MFAPGSLANKTSSTVCVTTSALFCTFDHSVRVRYLPHCDGVLLNTVCVHIYTNAGSTMGSNVRGPMPFNRCSVHRSITAEGAKCLVLPAPATIATTRVVVTATPGGLERCVSHLTVACPFSFYTPDTLFLCKTACYCCPALP